MHSLKVGTNLIAFPIYAAVNCSDGNWWALYPAILKAKTDIKAGAVLHSDGYQIETSRAVKAGESISVLLLGDWFLLSIEAADGVRKRDDLKPWLTVVKDDVKATDRASAFQAWRIEAERFGK